MGQYIKVILKWGRKRDLALSNGKMAQHMKENLIMICLMEKDYIFFLMEKNIMVIGKIIK